MALEADIYTEIWEALRAHRTSMLDYIAANGWFKYDAQNIPGAQLPAVCLYPVSIPLEDRQPNGDRFLLSLMLKGYVQNFDLQGIVEGAVGRKGILDLYHDLDRVLFSMIRTEEAIISSINVTTTTREFPVFTDVEAVRDIRIGGAEIDTRIYDENYPNQMVSIPIDIWYIKTDEVRRIA